MLCLPRAVARKGYKLGSRHKSIEREAYFHMPAYVPFEKRLQRLPKHIPFIFMTYAKKCRHAARSFCFNAKQPLGPKAEAENVWGNAPFQHGIGCVRLDKRQRAAGMGFAHGNPWEAKILCQKRGI